MKKLLNTIKEAAKYFWQLPQNLLGLILIFFYKPEYKHIMDNGNVICFASKMGGGISLGKYSIVNDYYYDENITVVLTKNTVRHEAIGHYKQSLIFGWFYLSIIGLSSITWASIYGRIVPYTYNGYYVFWTESWADKLAGIKR